MSKSQMKRINLQKGLPMDTPNHSEVARNIVDKFGIKDTYDSIKLIAFTK